MCRVFSFASINRITISSMMIFVVEKSHRVALVPNNFQQITHIKITEFETTKFVTKCVRNKKNFLLKRRNFHL